jgi:class 3 adenylate cyclase/tetratricopeptide (TPR) repeat protein
MSNQESRGQIQKLRAALSELREHTSVFSEESYLQIALTLLEKIRNLQTTIDPVGTDTVELAAVNPNVSDEVKPPQDEIRLVSVMFIDVKDSTEITRTLDSETWKGVIADSHKILSAIVKDAGGEVGQYLGDGLLCFFGARHSGGDDSLRAVSCALNAQRAINNYAKRVKRQYQIDFVIRIGISTGRVVVGMIGEEGKQEFVAMGTTTNLAARLQDKCPPGAVLVDDQTYYRVQNHFLAEPQPLLHMKGFDAPLQSYIVIERRWAQQLDDQIAGIQIPFVGRDAETAAILTQVEQAIASETLCTIAISGEIGMGKSRLLREINSFPFTQSVTYLNMNASHEKRETSYSLLHHLLAERCGLAEDTPKETAEQKIQQYIEKTWANPQAEATAAVIGFLAGYGFQDSPHIRPLARGGQEREQVACALLSEWFRGLSEEDPLLIMVDNAQWADSASLGLLRYMASNLKDCPIIILMASRPQVSRPVTNGYHWLHDLEITLHPLAAQATQMLIDAVFQFVDQAPPDLAETIRERAEGNPMFIGEFLRMMFDNGVFQPAQPGRWRLNKITYTSFVNAPLPNSLIGILQARLDDLKDEARHLAQIAAVVGQTFWDGSVARMAGKNVDALLGVLIERGIIVPNAESSFEHQKEYEFRHPLYREVAYDMLTRANRKLYHREAAQWLVERVFDKPDHMGTLAEHFMAAEMYEQALTMCLGAAEDRMQRGLFHETLKLIERGRDIARKVDQREIALPVVSKLLTLQGQTLNRLNRYMEASAESKAALRLMDELPAQEMIVERVIAARTLGNAYVNLGQYDDALEALKRADALLPQDDTRQRAAILRSFGALYWSMGQLNESLTYQQRALNHAEDSGNQNEIFRVLSMLGSIAFDRGDLATALNYFELIFNNNCQTGNIYYQILDLRHIGIIYRTLFAYEMALETFNTAEALQSRIQYHDPLLEVNRGLCLIALNRADEGLKLLEVAVDRPHQNAYYQQMMQLAYMTGLALIGQYEECRQRASEYVHRTRDLNRIFYGRGLLRLGMMQQLLGEPEALATLREALDNELSYGGQEAWRCYYALGNASLEHDPAFAHECFSRASGIIQAVINSLHSRPQLQMVFANSEIARSVLQSATSQPSSILYFS